MKKLLTILLLILSTFNTATARQWEIQPLTFDYCEQWEMEEEKYIGEFLKVNLDVKKTCTGLYSNGYVWGTINIFDISSRGEKLIMAEFEIFGFEDRGAL